MNGLSDTGASTDAIAEQQGTSKQGGNPVQPDVVSQAQANGKANVPVATQDVEAAGETVPGQITQEAAEDTVLPQEEASADETPDASANDAGSSNADSGVDHSASGTETQSETVPVEDGIYTIQSATGSYTVLDVAGGSHVDGANVQAYDSNNTAAQRWVIARDSAGNYTFQSVVSGKFLDVRDGWAGNGANVQQYEGNQTKAQQWKIVRHADGYEIVSALGDGFVLDLAGGNTTSGTNVQIYSKNDTIAQRWWFILLSYQAPSSVDGPVNGVYAIVPKGHESYSLDIVSASYGNGANVQIYAGNGTNAQRWYVQKGSDGLYSIKSISSGKALDVVSANVASGTNVQQYAGNGTNAQRWSFQKNADGSFTILNAVSGMALDISGANYRNGSNVQVYQPNGTAAQMWVLKATQIIQDGIYSIWSSLAPESKTVDVPGASEAAGMQLQLYDGNGTQAQKYRIRQASSDGAYTVQALASGLFLSDSDGRAVQAASTGQADRWVIGFDGNGLTFTNFASKKLLTVGGSQASNGARLQTSSSTNGSAAQRFRISTTPVITDGYYLIHNVNLAGKVLDVSGGYFTNGKNIDLYTANGTGAQVFYISAVGNCYKIENAKSFKVLDVAGGSTADGANVQQYSYNGTGAQLWYADLDAECHIIFKNANNPSKVLDLAGGSTADGANVQIYGANGTNAQKWRLQSSNGYSLTGNADLDRGIVRCWDAIGEDGNRLYNAYNYVSYYPYINGPKLYTSNVGDYAPAYALEMINNHGGNCYRFAALFCELARSIGYDAKAVSGWVQARGGGKAPHGWTEVYLGGKTYICDCDLYKDYRNLNWYMRTYANAPIEYHWW